MKGSSCVAIAVLLCCHVRRDMRVWHCAMHIVVAVLGVAAACVILLSIVCCTWAS